MGRPRPRLRALCVELARRHPHLDDPDALITAGEVLVNGFPRTNPQSLVGGGDTIALRGARALRGTAKLTHALRVFKVVARGRIAADVGAAAGGFTEALLHAGAARVYAIDVGHGQLQGSLRQDARVVNLERTNVADLDAARVPEAIGLITVDLSYLSIAGAAPQLTRLRIEPGAELIALVKPAFELGLPEPPTDDARLAGAVTHAVDGLASAGWHVIGHDRSPVRGSRGAVEYLVRARWSADR
jgi:23S rRNA (cytidine1920-2'-O)/16S rRNA (cytidine1409-2'-O)-methyltransferase